MDYKTFVHPNDEAALAKLKLVPGFDLATKWVMKFGVEQYCRGLYMANHIRLSEKQLPGIYNLLPPLCETLGIDVPELFLQMYPTPNAYTVGDQRSYIVITSGLLDCLGDGEELRAALAHECGHIACRHVFYTTMVQMMLNFGGRNELIQGIQEPLMLAYNFWSRQSEFSADRASAVCTGNTLTPIRMMLRLAGGPSRYTAGLDLDEYAAQMVESEGLMKDARWQKTFRDLAEMDEDHPYTATRVKELLRWGREPQFEAVVAEGRKHLEGGRNPAAARPGRDIRKPDGRPSRVKCMRPGCVNKAEPGSRFCKECKADLEHERKAESKRERPAEPKPAGTGKPAGSPRPLATRPSSFWSGYNPARDKMVDAGIDYGVKLIKKIFSK